MKKIFAALMLLLTLGAHAQSNYRAAEITDISGQIQSGYIDYREWDNTPLSINFKTNLDDKKPIVYTPYTLRSFIIIGLEKFSAYRVNISLNQINFANIPSQIDSTSKTENVFLKKLATGSRLNLYSYTDQIKTRLYIQEDTETPVELLYQEYYDNDHRQIKYSNTYLKQLNVVISKYTYNEYLLNLLRKTNYNKNDIENLVNNINGNKRQKKTSFSGRFFLSAAANVSSTAFVGENIFNSAPASSTYTPKISFGIDNFANPNIQKFIFRAEVSLSYINPKFEGKNGSVSFKQYTAAITPQLMLNLYNADALKVYLDMGVGFNFSQYTDKTYASAIYYSNGFPYTMNSFWLNFPVQAGVVLNKRLELFTLYSMPASYTQYGGFSIRTQALNVGARLLFKSKKK